MISLIRALEFLAIVDPDEGHRDLRDESSDLIITETIRLKFS